MTATPVSSGAFSITDFGKVIPAQMQILGGNDIVGGKSPQVLHPLPVARISIYRMRVRAPARKLDVSARGRGNNPRLKEMKV